MVSTSINNNVDIFNQAYLIQTFYKDEMGPLMICQVDLISMCQSAGSYSAL